MAAYLAAHLTRFGGQAGGVARGFSGTAVYEHEFTLASEHLDGGSMTLELAVRDIAPIVINGFDCGIVWTAPFEVDVSAAVRTGVNRLEVHVATPWRNRLIAEAARPTGQIFAPMTQVFEPTAEPLPAGLRGRCTLHLHG